MRAVERFSAAAEEIRAGTPPAVGIESRRQALRALIEHIDPVHLLGQVLNSEVPLDPETYRESDHEGLAYVAEMVAAEVVLRPRNSRSPETSPPMDANFLDEVRRLTQEAMSFEVLRRYQRAGAFESPAGKARASAAAQHLMLRNPGWAWQEHEVLRGLFGADHIASELRAALGFGVEEAIACSEAMVATVPRKTFEHMQNVRAQVPNFNDKHPAYRWASDYLPGWEKAPGEQQGLFIMGLWALNTIGEAYVMAPDDLAAAADVSVDVATAYVKALSLPMGQQEEDWFRMAEAVRERPWICLADDAYLLTVPGNDLWALRGVFEQQLKGSERYRRHRAAWLERRAMRLLEEALAPDEAWQGVCFSFEDSEGNAVAGEIDGLLRIGDVALIVEGKSATLRPGARRGGEALLKHLDENLRKAIEQGGRALDALSGDARLTVKGRPITLGEPIREVHPIVVTLDDLSSVAPVIWQLQGTKYVPENSALPWVVTLHELDLVCRTIEWPAQFVHFLRRRARLNSYRRHIASDELDWWMHYLAAGLYFDDDPDEGPERFTSMTDPLDAWVLYDQGERDTPAPKPSMNLDDATREYLDLICRERPPGWVAGACILLEVNGASRVNLWKEAARLRERAQSRDKVQRFTLGFEDSNPPQLICFVAVPDEAKNHLSVYLRHLVEERLDELGKQRVLGMGQASSTNRPYDALVIVDQAWRSVS